MLSSVLFPRIPEKDLKVLCGNFEELVRFQQSMYDVLEECARYVLLVSL